MMKSQVVRAEDPLSEIESASNLLDHLPNREEARVVNAAIARCGTY